MHTPDGIPGYGEDEEGEGTPERQQGAPEKRLHRHTVYAVIIKGTVARDDLFQCFGDPHCLVGWIRIHERAKRNQRKEKKFHVLKCWMFSFEG
jgi:hypothetical protein